MFLKYLKINFNYCAQNNLLDMADNVNSQVITIRENKMEYNISWLTAWIVKEIIKIGYNKMETYWSTGLADHLNCEKLIIIGHNKMEFCCSMGLADKSKLCGN